MLSIQSRIDNHNYSSPSSYWLTHLTASDSELESEGVRTNPQVRRRRQIRRLRYKQTHCWTVRLWHSFLVLFGHPQSQLVGSY
jgi:hypothetical protein